MYVGDGGFVTTAASLMRSSRKRKKGFWLQGGSMKIDDRHKLFEERVLIFSGILHSICTLSSYFKLVIPLSHIPIFVDEGVI